MANDIKILNDEEYQKWILDIKELVHVSQLKAAVQVNTEMIRMYWHIGKEISDKHADSIWGTGFYKTMSQSLKEEFPNVSGFSMTNLKYMKRFFEFYKSDSANRQQVVDDLENICSIPWGHHILIMTKCENVTEALFYVHKTLENGWSRAMLLNFLDVNLYKSQGKAITNFDKQLPSLQSDLAKEVIKDPYNFDFLTLTEGYREKELEDALTNNITKFLLELGQGFAYIGRQQPIMVGQKEMAIDLLFYHMKLRCYIVIDLKVGEFDASYTSQIGTYVVAVNHQLKTDMDNPTIGLIICKTKDDVVAEYSLEASRVPIGISEYQLSKVLPIGKLTYTILLAFAEFEKSLIVDRMNEGKEVAKANNPDFKEGRHLKFSKQQLDHAMELLDKYTYNEVISMTGISRGTLWRERRKRNYLQDDN